MSVEQPTEHETTAADWRVADDAEIVNVHTGEQLASAYGDRALAELIVRAVNAYVAPTAREIPTSDPVPPGLRAKLSGRLGSDTLCLPVGQLRALLAEFDGWGRELERLRDEQHEMTCPACQTTIRSRLADQQEQAELKRLREERTRLLSECDRIEQHVRDNVPHLPPDAGHLTVHVIRLLLGEATRRDDGGTGR